MADPSDVPTDLVPVLSSLHGRERRAQRKGTKRDLQAAVKYGVKQPDPWTNQYGDQRWKYTFADYVYITDSTSTREITSWPVQACGLDVEKVKITRSMQDEHDKAIETLRDKSTWTSHTVVIVDQSGSMRAADASEDATRSDLVWLLLALNLVSDKLRKGERKRTDVLSLITMCADGKAVVQMQPFDWLLFNQIVDLLRTSEPIGGGNYIPAFALAEDFLTKNEYGSCALFLLILSDGRPSDKLKKGGKGATYIESLTKVIKDRVGALACRFGRRLTVGAIALGRPGYDDFSTLRSLTEEAEEYGSSGVFQSASLSASALSTSMSRMTSMVTSTIAETRHFGRNRPVREFLKEKLSNIGGTRLTQDWEYVPMKRPKNDPSSTKRNIVRTVWVKNHGWTPSKWHETFSSREAVGVAFKKRWFGEGVERLVKEFREVDKRQRFVGPPMVAKDSRFIRDKNTSDEKEFHKVFCRAQQLAQKLACVFNRRLMALSNYDPLTTPVIEFLDCCVYMLDHPRKGRHGYLVERMQGDAILAPTVVDL